MPSDGSFILYRRAGTDFPRREVRMFARILQDRVTGGSLFTCLITDDRELERLNFMFCRQAHATDVLSFPSGEKSALGEMAISVDRARDQAAEFSHTTIDEIRILMLHGVLHLLGMDHESDRGAMARAERKWRTALGLPAGLIERVRTQRNT